MAFKALMYSRVSSTTGTGTGLYKKARVNAIRLGYFGPKQILSVNGTLRTNNFDRTNWEVTARGRGQGATLRIDVFGFTPAVGQVVILGAGGITNRLFHGTITRVTQVRSKKNEGRIVYVCQCVDWTYQLGNLRVTKKYQSTSATFIAQDLIATFAPAGFTSTHVQTGLVTLDEFQCTMQTLPSALQQLAERIGGAFYIDFDKDLHLYVGSDATGVNPEDLTDTNPHLRSGFNYESDIEGLKNRVLVEGKGSNVSTQITAGFTTLPVRDSGPFATSGTNEAKLEAQRITYTGVGALVGEGAVTSGTPGGGPTPPSPSHVAPYVTGNLPAGAYNYKVTFVSALGESDASAGVAASIAAVPWNFNDQPASVSSTTGGSLNPLGNYYWAVTFVTASGEVGHPVSGLTQHILGVSDTKANLSGIPVSSDARVTSRKLYRTADGGGALKLVATIGDNTTTTYTDTTADASLGVTMPTTDAGSTGKMTVGIPIGPTGTTSRKLYRTAIGGGSTYKLQSTTADNTTSSVLDNTADVSLGATFGGSTRGAAPGDTSLRVSDLSKFPDGGWLRVGSQVLYFTGRAAATGEGNLTGIPASGVGAITAIIPSGSTVVVEPHLTGIPAAGAGAIVTTIADGDSVNVLITANDTTSQGTYGIREDFNQQRGLSIDGCTEQAAARLAILKDPRISGSVKTTDPKMLANRPVTINHSGWGLTASVTVQQVTIKPSADRPQPMYEATLASRSLDDLFAQLRAIREQLGR